ncbi:MAG: vitamin K epoxide reductase family protein [bacterium]|nr:vitamin K epoxide reductase family protein [bacterium]
MQNIAPYLLIIFCAITGFFISVYIRHKKSSREVLVCPLNSNCEEVIHSDFSKFFGIPVEILGFLYYGALAVSYGFIVVLPEFAPPYFHYGLVLASAAAFLFSLYLTFIQAFTLREWCTWCLTSAMLSTIIFLSSVAGASAGFIAFLAGASQVLLVLYALAMAIGLGASTLTDISFFRFLKDGEISEWEFGVLRLFSEVIWFSLAIIILTGLGIFFGDIGRYSYSGEFLLKTVIIGVIVANGAVLNLYVMPRILLSAVKQDRGNEPGRAVRKISFALGAVSLVSWFSAFILGYINLPLVDVPRVLLIYVSLLLCAIIVSQIVESRFVPAKRTF